MSDNRYYVKYDRSARHSITSTHSAFPIRIPRSSVASFPVLHRQRDEVRMRNLLMASDWYGHSLQRLAHIDRVRPEFMSRELEIALKNLQGGVRLRGENPGFDSTRTSAACVIGQVAHP